MRFSHGRYNKLSQMKEEIMDNQTKGISHTTRALRKSMEELESKIDSVCHEILNYSNDANALLCAQTFQRLKYSKNNYLKWKKDFELSLVYFAKRDETLFSRWKKEIALEEK